MSSEPRSNSAVRNLRSIFENRASESSPSARGRSPGGLQDLDANRTRSKVRASFIPVEPRKMSSTPPAADVPESEGKTQSGVAQRRASMSEGHSGDAYEAIKETVNEEKDRRAQESSVADTIPETAIESAGPTPAMEVNKNLGNIAPAAAQPAVPTEDKPAENPDKHLTGTEEEPADMKPADPVIESAVSGGEALPPVAEDLRKNAAGSKPSSISTKAPKASSSVKSPVAQAKSPLSPKAPSQKLPTKKPSRTSLTAPTAASVARAAIANDKGASSTANAPKAKPRDVTKPQDISSRLTAPTAASRARLESNTTGNVNTKPTTSTTTSKPKPTTSARPTPRTSLAGRPESRGSQAASKKTGPVDGSFLERMTRPTAASANKTHERTEVKSPPRKQVPMRPKPNGQPRAKPSAAQAAPAQSEPEPSSSTHENTEPVSEPPQQAEPTAMKSADNGNETPQAQANGQGNEDPATLQATPAGIGSEDTIR